MPKFNCLTCGGEFKNTRRKPNPKYCTPQCYYKSISRLKTCGHNGDAICKSCYNKLKWKGTKDNEEFKRKNRVKRLWNRYGITIDQWEKMFESQGGKCPVCAGQLYRYLDTSRRAAAVDHDHKTKVVRGLVCHVCNRSRIGKNTKDTVDRLAAYLKSDFDGRSL